MALDTRQRPQFDNDSSQEDIDKEFAGITGGDDTSSNDIPVANNEPSSESRDPNRIQNSYDDKFNATSQGLRDRESQAGLAAGADQAEAYANDPRNASEDADGLREEESSGGGWRTTLGEGGNSGSKPEKVGIAGRLKNKAAMIGVTTLLGIFGIGFTLAPSLGGIHALKNLVDKLDRMTPVMTIRSDFKMKERLFGTTFLKEKFQGLTQRQFDRLKAQGGSLIDKDGNEVTKNSLGRYTGGVQLVMPSGELIHADQYLNALQDPKYRKLRKLSRSVFAPRYLSFNDSLSKTIRQNKKIPANQQWGDGDTDEEREKARQKSLYSAVSGQEATNEIAANNDRPTQKDANGNDVPVPVADGAENYDLGDDVDDIKDEVNKLAEKARSGNPIEELPSELTDAVKLEPFEGKYSAKKGIKSVVSFLNPADTLVGLCGVYQIAHVAIALAYLVEAEENMRFFGAYASTIDRVLAGEGTASDMTTVMSALQKADGFGGDFGTSFSYHYLVYGKVTSIPLTSSSGGNEVIQTLQVITNTVDAALGRQVVRTGCRILDSPYVQGALALTSFIPGGGQLAGGISRIVGRGGAAAVREIIEARVRSLAENLTRDALKARSKEVASELAKMARNESAMFLGGYIVERYGIPYIAHTLAHTNTLGKNGVETFDTMASGASRLMSIIGQERGLQPRTISEYKADVAQQRQAKEIYLADRRSDADPLDFTDPYSQGSQVAAAYLPLLSSFDIFNRGQGGPSLLPSGILSSFGSSLASKSAYAATEDIDAEVSVCQNADLRAGDRATNPYCDPIMGLDNLYTEPSEIRKWMIDNGQINEETQEPKAGSEYERFKTTCINGAEGKNYAGIGEDSQQFDAMCTDTNNEAAEDYFRMYNFDVVSVEGAMDGDPLVSGGTPSARPEYCNTIPAQDRAQIACRAYQFDNYGYVLGGGHSGTAEGFMNDFRNKKFREGQDRILDCSGLVRMAIYDATGYDIGGIPTDSYPSYNKFQEIPKENASAGDILWKDGHTELVVENDIQNKKFLTFGAHTNDVAFDKQIGQANSSYGYYEKVFRFIK